MQIPQHLNSPLMKKLLLAAAVMVAALSSSVSAQGIITNAFDVGANYGGSGEPGWTNGSSAGSGFGAWTISANGDAGAFIGNPTNGGVTGMSTESFVLYANGTGSGINVTATRSLNVALPVGATFSLQWGINFDGNNGVDGNKGFKLKVGGTDVVTVNNGGNADIQFNTINTGFGYGTTPMIWSFTYTNATTLFVSANDRDGSGTFTTNVTVSGGISSFELYATRLNPGDQDRRRPYYDNFTVTIPEPSTYALLALSAVAFGGYVIRRRRR